MKLLVIGAHPDDIEIFMYGFVRSSVERGDSITLAVATDGSKGNVTIKKGLKKVRAAETLNALSNIQNPIMLNYPDGELFKFINKANKISKLIDQVKPDLLLTHAPEDYHPDHRALSNIATNAAGFKIPILFADTLMGINFKPDVYIDISPFFKDKLKAILCHKSQTPEKFVNAVKIVNQYRASQLNAPLGTYAEAYRYNCNFPNLDIEKFIPKKLVSKPFYVLSSNSLI